LVQPGFKLGSQALFRCRATTVCMTSCIELAPLWVQAGKRARGGDQEAGRARHARERRRQGRVCQGRGVAAGLVCVLRCGRACGRLGAAAAARSGPDIRGCRDHTFSVAYVELAWYMGARWLGRHACARRHTLADATVLHAASLSCSGCARPALAPARSASLTPPRLTPAGNGSQWPRMAAELVEASPAFRASIAACARALERFGLDLLAEFGKPDGWSTPALAMAGLSAVQVPPSASLGSNAVLPSALPGTQRASAWPACSTTNSAAQNTTSTHGGCRWRGALARPCASR